MTRLVPTIEPMMDGRWASPFGTVLARLGTSSRAEDGASRRALAHEWLEELVETARLLAWPGLDAPAGKRPRLRDAALGDVSISHSADLLFVAVTDAPALGIDVEAAPFDAFASAALARRMCTPAERVAGEGLPASRRRRRLAELWTAKEARAKADGRGLAVDFRAFPAGAPATSATAGPVTCIAVVDRSGRAAWHRIEEFATGPAVRR